MEGTFRSVEPLAYSVNSVADLKENVVKAFENGDEAAIKELCMVDPIHYDIFICVNKEWHAFVLCVPVGNPNSAPNWMDPNLTFPTGNPFDVPDVLFCETFELCFDLAEQRMYKIKAEVKLFGEIKKKVKRSYYIARYGGLNINALQFTALRAAPKRYRVLLDDCVEFAKCFCVEALAYSSNYKEIEKLVERNIEQASGSGLSVENLSRRVRSSGWVGNTFLGGMDVSQLTSGRWAPLVIIPFLLICQFIVAYIAIRIWGGCHKM